MAKKNSAAVALGRRGGKARLEKMSAEERSAVAKKAAAARWKKKPAKPRFEPSEHPEAEPPPLEAVVKKYMAKAKRAPKAKK